MRNRALLVVGLMLIAVGALALFYKGIPYTSRDVVIDAGPITATAETSKTWPVSPIVGGLAVAGGVLLVVVGTRKA